MSIQSAKSSLQVQDEPVYKSEFDPNAVFTATGASGYLIAFGPSGEGVQSSTYFQGTTSNGSLHINSTYTSIPATLGIRQLSTQDTVVDIFEKTGNFPVFRIFDNGGTGASDKFTSMGIKPSAYSTVTLFPNATENYGCLRLNGNSVASYQIFSQASGANFEHIGFISGGGGGFTLVQNSSQHYILGMLSYTGFGNNVSLNSDGDCYVVGTTGNFGVGTPSPSARLQISQGLTANDIVKVDGVVGVNVFNVDNNEKIGIGLRASDYTLGAFDSKVLINNTIGILRGSFSGIAFYEAGNTAYGYLLNDGAPGNRVLRWIDEGSGTVMTMDFFNHYVSLPSASARFSVGTTSPSANLHIEGTSYLSGNVGIGTTAPSAKLHVNGSFITDGFVADQNVDFVGATEGGSYAIPNTDSIVVLDPTAGLTAYSLTMPASATNGQIVEVTGGTCGGSFTGTGNVVDSLTMEASPGDTLNAPLTVLTGWGTGGVGTYGKWVYRLSSTTWYRIG